ncbi:MAG: hypothetical protein K8L91_26920 [Anaerolineae bacterium]|nr:hypothetical protein [Anaerolineae bacterium]
MQKTYRLSRWFLIGLVALSFLASSRIAAQDNGEDDFVVSHRALVVMPSVIRFRIRVVATRDEVAEIKLAVREDETLLQTFDVTTPLDNLFIDFDDETEYEIVWDIRGVPLRPFLSTLTYEFEVTTTDGETAAVENEFIFQHDTIEQWQLVEGDTLQIYALGDVVDWSNHLPGLEQSLALLRENTGFAAPVGLMIYPADTQFCTEGEVPEDTPDAPPPLVVMSEDRAFPCDPADMTRFYANSDLVIAYVGASNFYDRESEAFAPLFDIVYSTRWENAEVPAWFRVGLRQLYNRFSQGQSIARIKQALQEDRMLSLAQMETLPAEDSEDMDLWQAQAYGFTLFLADVYGASAPFEIAKAVSPTLSLNHAIQQTTAQTVTRLYSFWLTWLDTQKAIAAAGWNPYLETTPTPVPTRTATSIPPTHTPRPTATVTLTPTSTYRGDFVPTVFRATNAPPTLPPTRTSTPLPPGSLNPTPTPRPANNDEESSGGVCGTGIGAVLIPAFGIVWMNQKKRKQARPS